MKKILPNLYAKRLKLKAKSGSLLVIAIIFLFFVLIFSMATFTGVANFSRFGSNATRQEQAVNLVEAGIDLALWQLNNAPDPDLYDGTVSSGLIQFGPGDIEIKVEHDFGTGSNKKIVVTGYIPSFGAFEQKAKGQVQVKTQDTTFPYVEQAGTGGIMTNVECLDIDISGNVYSNNSIINSLVGLCPWPIIHGEAWAVNTVERFTVDPGPARINQPSQSLPAFDSAYWEQQAAAGGTTSCSGSSDPFCSTSITVSGFNSPYSLGPKIIDGNLTISAGGELVVTGPLHVKGNFKMTREFSKPKALLRPDNSLGSSGTVILVDNCVIIGDGLLGDPPEIKATTTTPKGFLLIVSKNIPESGLGATCTTPVILIYRSTINAVIYNLAGEVWLQSLVSTGRINLTGALAGKYIYHYDSLDFGQRIKYDADLANAGFPTGGSVWQIVRGTYKFTK